MKRNQMMAISELEWIFKQSANIRTACMVFNCEQWTRTCCSMQNCERAQRTKQKEIEIITRKQKLQIKRMPNFQLNELIL